MKLHLLIVIVLYTSCVSSLTWTDGHHLCSGEGRGMLSISRGEPLESLRRKLQGSAPVWLGARLAHTSWLWEDGEKLYKYMGCYARPEYMKLEVSGITEVFDCYRKCNSEYTYVAIHGNTCACFESIDLQEVDVAQCSQTCDLNFQERCGGPQRVSVYNRSTDDYPWTARVENADYFDCVYVNFQPQQGGRVDLKVDRCGRDVTQFKPSLCEQRGSKVVTVDETYRLWSLACGNNLEKARLTRLDHPGFHRHPYTEQSYWIGLNRTTAWTWTDGHSAAVTESEIRRGERRGNCLAAYVDPVGKIRITSLPCDSQTTVSCNNPGVTFHGAKATEPSPPLTTSTTTVTTTTTPTTTITTPTSTTSPNTQPTSSSDTTVTTVTTTLQPVTNERISKDSSTLTQSPAFPTTTTTQKTSPSTTLSTSTTTATTAVNTTTTTTATTTTTRKSSSLTSTTAESISVFTITPNMTVVLTSKTTMGVTHHKTPLTTTTTLTTSGKERTQRGDNQAGLYIGVGIATGLVILIILLLIITMISRNYRIGQSKIYRVDSRTRRSLSQSSSGSSNKDLPPDKVHDSFWGKTMKRVKLQSVKADDNHIIWRDDNWGFELDEEDTVFTDPSSPKPNGHIAGSKMANLTSVVDPVRAVHFEDEVQPKSL